VVLEVFSNLNDSMIHKDSQVSSTNDLDCAEAGAKTVKWQFHSCSLYKKVLLLLNFIDLHEMNLHSMNLFYTGSLTQNAVS